MQRYVSSADATLLNRANHTGTQTASTISDLAETTRDTVATALVPGPNVTITYNDAADSITIGSTGDGGGGGGQLYSRGINAAGGEFAASAATLPGSYNTDYAYDTAAAFLALAGRGHELIRLPFRWERIQPTRNAALNSAELGRLQAVVSDIAAAGMTCILDVHNYARYINSTANGGATLVLGDTLPTADLVDLWTRLSTAFKTNPGVYAYGLMNEPHDLPTTAGGFTGTTRYNWNDGTVQGWTGDGATVANVSSKLRFTATPSGSGFYQTRKDDVGTDRLGPVTGNVLEVTATLSSGAVGTWGVLLQWQNSSFAWQNPTSTTYTRVDTGATVSALVPGVAVRVRATHPSTIPAGRPFAMQVESNNPVASTLTVDMDDFAQGTVTGGTTGRQLWESASQQLVTAIRNNGDTKKIMVPGYNFSGAQNWTTTHPAPWITDPGANFAYEAHYYFDVDNSGDYPDSYATENAAAVSAGYASLTARATTQLSVWLNWLNTHDVDGFLGEFGWPNTADTASWNAVGEALYDLCDTAFVDATYWATGARWGSGYNLSAYTGTNLDTVKAQASVIESHPGAALDTPDEIADLQTRVTALEGSVEPTHAAPHLGPAFMVIGATTSSDLATSATNRSTHGLIEVKWDQCQSTAGGAVDASSVITNIDNILDAGMKVCLRVSPQYPPSFVQSGVPPFRRQGSVDYTATQSSGNNVRDWVWSATGRDYLQDFMQKLFAQLDWSKIERVQVGGLVAGELAYPVNDGTTPYWWGFSTPAQTGTGIAPRMAPCPVPGTTPSSGTTWTDNDEIFVAWYMQSLINFMVWYIEQHRKWFSGPIWVLHPSSGLRKVSQTPTGAAALNYRLEAARGTDWEWQVGAYPDPDVHPYCTWADAQHFWTAAPYNDVNDANAAPWYHLLRVARRAGRAARIWGENTVVESSNAVMDRVFHDGAVAFGYEGFTWLNHTSLATGTNDTYANWAARILEVDVDGGTSAYPSGAAGGGGGGGGGLDTEAVQDVIGSTVTGAGLVSATYNDLAGTHTIATTATANSSDATLLDRANHTGTQAATTIGSGTLAAARLGSGTANSTTFLRGDQTWAVPGGGGGSLTPGTGKNTLTGMYHADGYSGVDPTGVADSTSGINTVLAAVPQGNTVYFPPGTYKITGALTAPANEVRLQGAGTATLFDYQPASAGTMLTLTNKARIRFLDMQFRLPATTAGVGSTLITLSNTFRCSFTRCQFTGRHDTVGDVYGVSTGHIGVRLTANAGDNIFYDCDWHNLGVGVQTDCIQNAIIGGKIGTCFVGVYGHGTQQPGMVITGYVDFVSFDDEPGLVSRNIWCPDTANDWMISNCWFEGGDVGIEMGDGAGSGPAFVSISNCHIATNTTGVKILGGSATSLSEIDFRSSNGNATARSLEINSTFTGGGTARNLRSLITSDPAKTGGNGQDLAAATYPASWTVIGAKRDRLSNQLVGASDWITDAGTKQAGVLANGTIVIDGATTGLVLRDSANKYWRLTVATNGSLTVTGLTTTRPTS